MGKDKDKEGYGGRASVMIGVCWVHMKYFTRSVLIQNASADEIRISF